MQKIVRRLNTEVGEGGRAEGGLFERGSLLFLARMMVSILHRDLERKVEMLKYMKLEVMQPRFIFFFCNFVVIE